MYRSLKLSLLSLTVLTFTTACNPKEDTSDATVGPLPPKEEVVPVELPKVEEKQVKEGVEFLTAAEALEQVAILREDPDNFYEKLKKCRITPAQNICPDMLKTLERVIALNKTERPKHDLNIILSQIEFFYTLDEAELRENYLVTTTPVGKPRPIPTPEESGEDTSSESNDDGTPKKEE